MRRRRLSATLVGLLAAAALAPAAAQAHGLPVPQDLPIPRYLFVWAAAVVLGVSFFALATLWPEPRLARAGWRPLPGGIGRALASGPVQVLCGAVGVFLLGLTIYAGLHGEQTVAANWTPTFVYVIFWVGLVIASVLFGDVFRAFNPWRAIARAIAWIARTAARTDMPAPLTYPARLGRWPAVLGLFGFAVMELAYAKGDQPDTLAIAVLIYSAATFVGMALYGIEPWNDRAEAFSVYFNLFSRLSAVGTRDGEVGVRTPLSGVTKLEPLPGTIPLLAVMIGSVSFDGFAENSTWTGFAPDLGDRFKSLGFNPEHAFEATNLVGLLLGITVVYCMYRLGIAGVRSVGGPLERRELGYAFIHSLVPIAFAYVGAHYATLLVHRGQAIIQLASDPLGKGSDLFGTADRGINYFMSANATWYTQVALVVTGHVAGLCLAHDRALELYSDARQAVRSQYWMLGVMVFFTCGALFLLSQANG